ncbi:hypothetical protein HPB49_009907 [Dermacentor silvarum]|uniref:Uncharacterized protein n=1 Tax=Dermacentor silvarum TaxID=543639 RepID=A0ACB8D4K5_DERSI|nr:hypothetical protein HPB49_009907 [Dermacentor silvarum]
MDERSPEEKQSRSAATDSNALRSPSREGSWKASVRGRGVTDEAATTKSRKANATGSRISHASSALPRPGASCTGVVKTRPKKQATTEAAAPAPPCPSGSGAPTSTTGLFGSGVASSPSTATVIQEAPEHRTAPTGVSGEAPRVDVAAHSASSPTSGGVLAAVDSTGVASVDAARTQATGFPRSAKPQGFVTAGSLTSGLSSSDGACDLVLSSLGSGASVASPGGSATSLPMSPTATGGAPCKLSSFSSPGTAGSPMADVSALLRLHKRPITMSTPDSQSGQSSVRVEVFLSPNPASPQRKRREQRFQYKSNEGSISVEKLRQLSSHKPDQAVDKSKRLFLVLPGVSFLVLLIVASVAYLMMTRPRVNEKTTDQNFCTSGGCVEHADIIGLSDVSKGAHKSSPCDDFGHFVCSVWEARHKENIVRKRFTQSVVLDAVMDLIVSLEKFSGQRHALDISQRPARMMDACLTDRPTDDEMTLNQLLDFMRNTSFGFPEEDVDVSNYSRPLHALTELAYNWALPLWFYVDLIIPRNSTAAHMTISLSRSPFGDLYNSLHEALVVYEDVYLWYVDTLTAAVYRGNVSDSFRQFTRESKLLQTNVFANLSGLIRAQYHNPILLTVQSLPSFVVNTSVEHWLEALRPLALRPLNPAISEQAVVYITDREMLVVMNALFQAYSARDIYLHVNWWFVQILGSLASNNIFDGFRRDPERGHLLQKIVCSVQMILNYNVILASEQRALQKPRIRANIVDTLFNVHSVAASKVNSAMGARMALLLEQMRPFLWPPERHASEDGLLRLYGNATIDSEEQNFIQLWLSRAASYQQSWASVEERSSDASLFRMDTSLVASHHIVLKTVSLSLALLKAPFYYPDATSAIIYGGVGFIYATELVRVLNSLSLLLDGRNSIVPSPEAGFSQSYVFAPYSCSGMAIPDIFPRYMGLELAYAAYRQFRSDAEDKPLWNAKEYSPEQVFFATVCYVMCDMDTGADACTAYMKHFPEFAKAFSCPPRFAEPPCDIFS